MTARKRRLFSIVFSLGIIAVVGLIFFKITSKPAKADWYDENWGYRQTVTFSHNADISSERRVTITISTAALVTAGKIQSTCADARFTDTNGKLLRYQLTSACNLASTTFDVVFPTIINGTNTGYFYYGNPSAIAGATNVSGITSLGSAGSTGGPIKVSDAANFGVITGSGRQIVRTSTGTLYTAVNNAGSCEIWKSTDGTSWTQQDSSNNPVCDSGASVSIAITSTDIIHVTSILTGANPDLFVSVFTTSSDTFTPPTTVISGSLSEGCSEGSLAIDSNNVPHVACIYSTGEIRYSNKVGGSWNTVVTVESGVFTILDLAIDEDNFPEFSYVNFTDSDLTAATADRNNPTLTAHFTKTDVDTTVVTAGNIANTSIAVDSSGNTWIGYVDENGATDFVTIIKHNDADAWSTWQSPITNSNAGNEPTIAIDGSDVYVLYEDEADDIKYDRYNGVWLGETNLQTGTFQDTKAKWSYLNNNQGSTQTDYLYSDGTDIYWASFTPSVGPTVTLGSEEKGTGPISSWSFDEGQGTSAYGNTSQQNTLTVTNAVWKTEDNCVSSKCLYFDGDSDRATKSYSSDTELLPSTGSFSVSAWLNHIYTTGADTAISRVDGVNGVGWKIYMDSSGFICFGIDAAAGSFPSDSTCSKAGGTRYADSKWHFVTAVKTGTSKISIYIDGILVSQDISITGTTLDGTNAPITIGNDFDNGTNGWYGLIDEVKYYNYARSEAQIKADFAARGSKGASSVLGSSSLLQSSLKDGLVGYWKMDETSANSCTGAANDSCDSSGNGNDGAWSASTTTTTGKYINATTYDGIGDLTNIPSSTLYNNTTSTWSFWFKSTDAVAAPMGIAGRHDSSGSANGLTFWFNTGGTPIVSVKNGVGGSVDIIGDAVANDGSWHHLAFVVNGTSAAYLYIDGILNDTNTPPAGWNFNSQPVRIGKTSDTFWADYNGQIDDFRIYSRALSREELNLLWAPGPIGHWKMDEGTGISETSDSSGYSHTASLNSMTANNWIIGRFGNAINFNGPYANAYSASLNSAFNGNVGSVSMWLKLPASTWGNSAAGTALEFGTDVNNRIQIQKPATNNTLDMYFRANGTSVNTSYSTTTTDWFFVTMTWDTTSTQVKYYFNGIQFDQDTTSSSYVGTLASDRATIGAKGAANQPILGLIDDVRIYNYVRTPKQIVEDMNGGHPAGGSPVGSMLGYWKFDEGTDNLCTGGTNDVCNSGFLGSLVDGAESNMAVPATATSGWQGASAAKINRALAFDATDDVVNLGSNSAIDNLPSFSVSGWIKPTGGGEGTAGRIIEKAGNHATDGEGWLIYTTSSNQLAFSVTFNNNAGVNTREIGCTITGITFSAWQHFVVTWDGTNNCSGVNMYLNGVRKYVSGTVTGTLSTRDSDAAYNLLVGNEPGGTRTFDGLIDELKLYNYPLSQSDVLIDYNAGSAITLGGVLGTQNNEGSGGNSPVGNWNLNSSSGTSAYDLSGNGNIGTLVNSPLWVTGKTGSSLKFNGTNQWINLGNANTSLRSTGSMTVGGWVWLDPAWAADGNIFIRHDGSNWGIRLYVRNDKLIQFSVVTTSGGTVQTDQSSTASISTGGWHHIVGVWNSGVNMKIYIDGQLDKTTTKTGTVVRSSATDPSVIGAQSVATTPDLLFSGRIDEVKFYDYAQSAAQVAYDYNRGAPVAWYKFDECQGTTAYNSAVNSNGQAIGLNGIISAGTTGGPNTSVGSCSSGTSTEMWNNGTTGKYNSSLDFDGDSSPSTDTDIVTVASNSSLNFIDGDSFTITGWFKAATVGTARTLIAKKTGNGEAAVGYLINFTAGQKLNAFVADTTTGDGNQFFRPTASTFDADIWYHFAFVFDEANGSSESKFYINGKSDNGPATGTISGLGDLTTVQDLIIGAESDLGAPFDGQIDDIRIYRYPLTQDQVKQVMNNGAQFFGPTTGTQ